MPSPEIVTHAASPGQATARRRHIGPAATATSKPAVPKLAAHKPTPAQQLTGVFGRLKHLLLTEWPSIRSMNLGRLSALEPAVSSKGLQERVLHLVVCFL